MSDVRRCRRCKRKRMDDEPPEVKQYKTCAKCRIIERQKKKLRKPLAEETMLYGMKQFQQQNQNLNFTHEDIFMDDELFNGNKQKDNSTSNGDGGAQYQYQYTYQQSPGATDPLMYNDSNRSTGNATASSIPQSAIQTPNPSLQTLNYQQIAQRALPLQSTNLPRPLDDLKNGGPYYCGVCETKLDPNDEESIISNLCLSCHSDPFGHQYVHQDYNEFLSEISENRLKDVRSQIFMKEIETNFVENLSSLNQVISNEKQFRELVLNMIKKIYIEPIIAIVGYEFVQSSSNVGELSSSAPTINNLNQYQYKDTKPIKAHYKCSKEINNESSCNSNLFLDFNSFTNYIQIKFDHKVHNFFINYPLRFINILYEIMQEQEKEYSGQIGFNKFTSNLVYHQLINNLSSYPEDLQTIIKGIKKDDFNKEFHHLEDIITKNKDKLLTKQLSEEPEELPADGSTGGTTNKSNPEKSELDQEMAESSKVPGVTDEDIDGDPAGEVSMDGVEDDVDEDESEAEDKVDGTHDLSTGDHITTTSAINDGITDTGIDPTSSPDGGLNDGGADLTANSGASDSHNRQILDPAFED